MASLYWLASYPKSGNTWMRVLLTNYLRNGNEPADINDLEGGPIASARAVFDDHVGIEASDLSQDEIERYRPYVYEYLSREHERRLAKYPQLPPPFLKVHDAYTYTTEGIPLLSKAATAGVIYLVRHPFDVAVSFAHHGNTSVEKTVERMNDSAFTFVDNPTKLHNQLRQKLLTWSGHVRSWLEEKDLRVIVVRYEDLLADTVSELSRVLRFIGLEDEPERVAKAVRFSSFGELQSQEAKNGFREKMPKAKSFFRSGKAESWKEMLSEALQAKLVADHGEVMHRFGYLTDAATLPEAAYLLESNP
jgi:aryl sulfotransferase